MFPIPCIEGTMTFCPNCKRELREGIWLSPLKARIFDLVQRAGRDGIRAADIGDIVGVNNIRVHVQQINNRLYGTNVRLRADIPPRGFYRLIRSKTP
jgi:hypothetical protein